MNKKQNLLIAFILIAIWFRLIPHPPNFTPVTSLALFSGIMFQRKWLSILIPILAMVLSDFILGFSLISAWVYLGFALISIMGWSFNQINTKSITRTIQNELIFY